MTERLPGARSSVDSTGAIRVCPIPSHPTPCFLDSAILQAIRDGVLRATLDHEVHTLQSAEAVSVYATREPQEALHRRIRFCMDVHNEAVRVSHRNHELRLRLRPHADADVDTHRSCACLACPPRLVSCRLSCLSLYSRIDSYDLRPC